MNISAIKAFQYFDFCTPAVENAVKTCQIVENKAVSYKLYGLDTEHVF